MSLRVIETIVSITKWVGIYLLIYIARYIAKNAIFVLARVLSIFVTVFATYTPNVQEIKL